MIKKKNFSKKRKNLDFSLKFIYYLLFQKNNIFDIKKNSAQLTQLRNLKAIIDSFAFNFL